MTQVNDSAEANRLYQVMTDALEKAKNNNDGKVAAYIPELESVPEDLMSAAVLLPDGTSLVVGDEPARLISLQSVAKLVVLIGLLEEQGAQKVFSWVKVEPSGDDFASVARLDQFGPVASNPMLNAGAITLCSRIEGTPEQKLQWLDKWMSRCFGEDLSINHLVFASERRTGARNRSLGYLLKSTQVISGGVEETLETYFYLCSFQATIAQVAYLGLLLANRGCNSQGEQILKKSTVNQVIAIMTTCGLYNESGTHLVRTGIPAKSGVSGLIVASALKRAGIAVMSPRVNRKGTSIRGELFIEQLSQKMGWHFAEQ